MRIRLFIILLVLALSTSSCATMRRMFGSAADNQLGTDSYNQMPGTRTMKLRLSRSELLARAQQSGGLNTIRLIEIYERERSSSAPPRYRVFGVQPGSIYELLGLNTADVLLAAEGRVVYTPTGFPTYILVYLPKQSKATIDISREGQPIHYEYEIFEGSEAS